MESTNNVHIDARPDEEQVENHFRKMKDRCAYKPIIRQKSEIRAIAKLHGYELQKTIGKGSFGKIYNARNLKSDSIVAIKVLQGFNEHNYTLLKVIREIAILSSLSSIQANFKATLVSPMLDTFCPASDLRAGEIKTLFIVMSTYKLSLFDIIQQSEINEAAYKLIFYQLLCSLRLMHSSNIIHRDLKPHNILVNPRSMEVVICDFGLSRTLPESSLGKHNGNTMRIRDSVLKDFMGVEEEHQNEIKDIILRKQAKVSALNKNKKRSLTPHISTRFYRSPEVCLRQANYDQATDIWALGCVMVELLQSLESSSSSTARGPSFLG